MKNQRNNWMKNTVKNLITQEEKIMIENNGYSLAKDYLLSIKKTYINKRFVDRFFSEEQIIRFFTAKAWWQYQQEKLGKVLSDKQKKYLKK